MMKGMVRITKLPFLTVMVLGIYFGAFSSSNSYAAEEPFPAKMMNWAKGFFTSKSSSPAPMSLPPETYPTGVPSASISPSPKNVPSGTPSRVASSGSAESHPSSQYCLVDEGAIADMRKAKLENMTKQNELNIREAELGVKEKAISEQFQKLEALRASITQLQETKSPVLSKEKVSRVVETLLSMNPKSASKLLSTMDDELAVSAMDQMEAQRLAKIMNLMEATRSSKLIAIMVDYKAKKGGKGDGTKQPNSSIQ